MDNNNNKGFTLVELLAVLSVLSILMLLAVPNVVGIVQRNKNKTYVEDAKKLATLAEYKINSNSELKPDAGNSYCFYLDFLDKSHEIDEPPNGGEYHRYLSYVKVYNDLGNLKYSVQLTENKEDGTKTGINEVSRDELFADDATSKLIKTSPTATCKSEITNKSSGIKPRYYWDKDSNPSESQMTSSSSGSVYSWSY